MAKNRWEEEKIRNFYYLLAYALEDDRMHFKQKELFGTERFENIYDLLAVVLYMRMNEMVKEGLYSEYINYHEELPVVKGRIDIVNTIRYNTLQTQNKVICDYDDYSTNNILNQIVKTTIFYMLKMDIMAVNKLRLRQLYYQLGNIDIIKDWRNIQWDAILWNRLNSRYKFLIKICQYILNHCILSKESENELLESFDDDQDYDELFEKFIRNYLILYYTKYRNKKIRDIGLKSERMQWNIDEDKPNINKEYVPSMLTDVTITRKNKVKIIDAKFYSTILSTRNFNGYQKERINRNHWYQIQAYVSNKKYMLEKTYENSQVSGMLLYAQTEEERFSNFEVDVYVMGNRIQVKTIDFTKKFGNPYHPQKDTIVWQMRALAEEILEDLK